MINPFNDVNWKPEKSELRKFGKSMTIGFSILALVFYTYNSLKGVNSWLPLYLFSSGLMCFIFSHLHLTLGRICYWIIYSISCSIGLFISNILLIVFYYLFFTPIALVVRLSTRRDPLKLKKPTGNTNWNKYDSNVELKRYFKQY